MPASYPELPDLPAWVDSGAAQVDGLDLLGLRAPAQRIGNHWLNGITTVSPAVRYLGLRTWIVEAYWRHGRPDHWSNFARWAKRVECALVLANLSYDSSTPYLVGSRKAARLLHSEDDPIPLDQLVSQAAISLYAGPSDQLGITRAKEDTGMPQLTAERGLPLAQAVGEALNATELGGLLAGSADLTEVNRSSLEELGRVACLAEIPHKERRILLDCVIPENPLGEQEKRRVASYGLLLALARRDGKPPDAWSALSAVCQATDWVPEELMGAADGWTRYELRDCLAAAHEAVLGQVSRSLSHQVEEGRGAVPIRDVLTWLLERGDEINDLADELELLREGERVFDLSWHEVRDRVRERLGRDAPVRNGLRRWATDFTENDMAYLALSANAGALLALPLAWLLVEHRAGPGVDEGLAGFSRLSTAGWGRVGFEQVLRPTMQSFDRENPPISEVMGRLAVRTVDQHMRIAWARLASDARRDVSVMVSDGDEWMLRRKFGGGRTDSRLWVACSWLGQLGLWDSEGLTTNGADMLQRCLRVCAVEGGKR